MLVEADGRALRLATRRAMYLRLTKLLPACEAMRLRCAKSLAALKCCFG